MKTITFDVETTGLDPLEEGARITCICAITSDKAEYVFCQEDEKRMLSDFLAFLKEQNPQRIYGFNVAFDIRWVMLRALKHNLPIPVDIRAKAVDLQKVLSCGQYKCKGKLEDYAHMLSLAPKNGNGKEAIQLWNEGRLEELQIYCMQDVKITHNLMIRMKQIGIV